LARSQNLYSHKTKALEAIWHAKLKDVMKDVQRAFTIWCAKNIFDKLRERKVKNLVLKAYTDRLSQGFRMWLRNE